MNNLEILESLGFNKNEAKVYFAVLELGESTVLPISKKASIKRTYCYDILNDLLKKGAISCTEKRGRRRYSAVEPAMIQKLFEAKVQKFESILPQLQNIYQKTSTRPRTRYLEGKKGIEIIIHEMWRDAKEVRFITSAEEWTTTYPDYADYIGALVKARIKVYDLIRQSKSAGDYSKLYKPPLQEARYLPKNSEVTCDFVVWNNTFVMISYGTDIHTVAVESEQIAKSMIALHKLLWEKAKIIKK